jgi:hypothetical protein
MIFKKLFVFFIMVTAYFSLVGNTAFSWELYDDFSSGTLDPVLWNVDEPNLNVSSVAVVDGKLRIKLRPIVSDDGESVYDFARVYFAKNPETIKAIKVKVLVEKCTEDARARLRVERFKESIDAYFYQAVNFFGGNNVIEVWAEKWHILDDDDLYWWTSLPFHNPTDVIGNNFTAIIKLHHNIFDASIIGLGQVLYKPYDVDMTPESEQRITLDVRSSSGTGEVVVFYDDVYVEYYSKKRNK